MTRSPHIVLSETLQGRGQGAAIALDDAQRHHLRTVLRLAAGAGVSVTDGDGHTAEGELGETAIRLTAAPRRTPPRIPRIVLAQAVTKGRRLDDTVRAVCELGVDLIVPFVAARTQGRPDGREAEALRARWRAIAVAALSQSRGAWVTSIGALVDVPTLAAAPGTGSDALGSVRDGLRLVAHPGGASLPVALTAARAADPAVQVLTVAIGPEGGFSPEELELFAAGGWQPVGLGPTVLRSEHAGPAALAVVAVVSRRWDVDG
jgi:16S rRNA (uracil1498-N3)-methyltransferase